MSEARREPDSGAGRSSGTDAAPGSVRLVRLRRGWSRLAPWQQAAIVVGIGALGFGLMLFFRPEPARLEPPPQVPIVTTAPAEARSGAIWIRGGGTVRPSAEVILAPQVGGRVSWVARRFVSGGRFDRGAPLLRIDPADFENAVAAAEAEVASREVDVLRAEEEVALAREEYRRIALREGLDPDPEAAGALVLREPQLEAARAALRGARARLEDARLALERTWLRAPFDGIVREESVDMGQFVGAGQGIGRFYATAVAEVVVPLADDEAALIDGLWEVEAGSDRSVLPARVAAEFGGRRFEWAGYVDRAESALDEETRTVNVVLRVPSPFRPSEDDPDRPPLLLGTYVTADIRGREIERYAAVPAAALRDDGGDDAVWAVRADSLLHIVRVTLIQRVEDTAYVAGDLPDGQPVVISSLPFVTDGMTVRVATPLETAVDGASR